MTALTLATRCAFFYRGAQCDAERQPHNSRCAIHGAPTRLRELERDHEAALLEEAQRNTPAALTRDALEQDDAWRAFCTSSPAPHVNPATMAAAARYVEREYGDAGYTIASVAGSSSRGVFRVRHFDGSEFYIVADRYENVAEVNAWRP